MTLGGFIEYVLDNDCDIARDYNCEVLQFKRRGKIGDSLKVTITYTDKSKVIKPITVCRVCHGLGIEIPPECKEAEKVVLHILEHHKDQIAKKNK
jgi:hypothetical protein